jgi:hypothetical protein
MCVARLDGEGRYFGMTEVDADAVPPGAVVVTRECDLPVDGSYRYDRQAKSFVRPVPRKDEPANMHAETVAALAGVGFAMRAADLPMPALTLRWLAWFETTLDYTGLLSKKADGVVALSLVKPSEFKD